MSAIRRTALRSAMATTSTTSSDSAPIAPEASRPSDPLIDVSGVRNSWLTVDRNPSFTRSTSLSRSTVCSSTRLLFLASTCSRRTSSMLRTRISTSARSIGLLMKSFAPAWSARSL